MNILVVSPKFHPVIGGGETFVLNSVKKLHELGWQISVAVEPHSNRKISDYPFTVHELEGLSDDNLNLVQAVGNILKILENNVDSRGFLTNEHRYLAVAKKTS